MFSERWSRVSRQILIGISLELLIVTVLLAGWGGLSLWASVAIALAAIVLFRCLVSLITFLISWWYNSRSARPEPLGLRRSVALVGRETLAFIKLFFYYHPFEPVLNRHDPDTRTLPVDHVPVLFVHGFYVNAGFWIEFKHYFRQRGYEAVYSMNLDPPFDDIDRLADRLAQRIVEVVAHSGRQKITLIAQSMGGLVCRAYLSRYGGEHAHRLITLGTPHHGTVLACLLSGDNIKQMRPGNDWLGKLNEAQMSLRFSNHLSLHDNVVVPRDNARFFGAKDVEYHGLGHVSMAFSGEMMQRVFREAAPGGLNT